MVLKYSSLKIKTIQNVEIGVFIRLPNRNCDHLLPFLSVEFLLHSNCTIGTTHHFVIASHADLVIIAGRIFTAQ